MKHIVMVGTRRDTMGGIAAVVNVYERSGMFRRFPMIYLASHCDGSAAAKLQTMATALARFLVLLLRGEVGLLHAHVASRASFWRKSMFFALAWLFRVPAVLHLHGGEFRMFYERECGALRRAAVRWIFRHTCRVIVLSPAWQQWVQAMSGHPRVEVIVNPVPLAGEGGATSRAPDHVLCLGRLNHGKGTYDLLNAVARLPAVQLFLAGDGELEDVRATAEGLGIADRVHILGWLGPEGKRTALAQAAVFALPSYHEGLPMSVLEAMAAGLPVVSTPVGGIPQAVSDGVEGFLVTPGDVDALTDRLARLLADPALARRMGAAARRKVEAIYACEAVLPRIERIYRDNGFMPA